MISLWHIFGPSPRKAAIEAAQAKVEQNRRTLREEAENVRDVCRKVVKRMSNGVGHDSE